MKEYDALVEKIKKLQKRVSNMPFRTIFDDGRLAGYREVINIIESMKYENEIIKETSEKGE